MEKYMETNSPFLVLVNHLIDSNMAHARQSDTSESCVLM